MANKSLYIAMLLFACLLCDAKATDLCKEMKLGWHFYCEELEKPQVVQTMPEDPKARLKQIQEKLEDLKIKAIMQPTPDNVAEYIAFQQEQLERASAFSNTWQKVIWSRPELDYMVKTPISTAGNELRSDIRGQDIKDTMNTLNERYGLFFFYGSTCSFCHRYSSILKAFSEYYGLEVMAVSLDGGILDEWPNSLVNNGQTERLGLAGKPVPATVLFDNITQELIPIGFGLLTISELEERIYELTKSRHK
ncbi:MAG: conjugal transfer protein TraF [Candidatus Midichloriaceae bacterium]|jgi:conjugal transfer pilus assembly protein TraF|nr:conjugal transfer protein TraF [Candidatus Midichloriaceae bacterium]